MRILADENFPGPIVDFLRRAGNDVLWVKTNCATLKDPELLNLAESEARIMLTLDKDFWQIALQRRVPLVESGVVLFRVHPATPQNIQVLIHVFLESASDWRGHISVVTSLGIKMVQAKRKLSLVLPRTP